MQTQSFSLPSRNPATFSGLMDVYERNYLLLKHLLVQNGATPKKIIERSDTRSGRLCIEVLQISTWTTTVRIRYSVKKPHGAKSMLDLIHIKVRIYDDTRQAAIFEPDGYFFDHITAHEKHSDLFINWYLNKFLYNVLNFSFNMNMTI